MTTPIQLDSLSNHQVSPGEHVYGYGSGFQDVTGVQVGAEWAPDFTVDGATIVTFTVPHGAGGASEWVVVHRADGTASPCLGDEQRLTYVDPLAAPSGPLRLDSITPETVTLGRADSYWLLGGGLSSVSGVMVGHSGCEYETYDDERLIVHVPEHVRSDAGATTVRVQAANATGATVNLQVPCIQLADATSAGGAPAVLWVDPTSLPSSGGRLTIHGGGMQEVTWVHVGGTVATIESVHHDVIVVTVGSLADSVGQRLGVEVGNDQFQNYAIGNDDHITVTG